MHGLGFETIKKAAFVTGTIGLLTSATMTAKFGYETSMVHAVGFVCVTVLAAIIYPAVAGLRSAGMRKMAIGLACAAPFFITLELFGDLGYTIGMRDKSVKGAVHQTTSHDDIGVSIQEASQQVAMYEARLKSLTEANQWTATVNADGLKGQLASANLAIEQEAARGGCKGKCLELTKKRDDLTTRISVAEEVSKLPGMIEATKTKLEKLRSQRKDTPAGHAAAKSQTDFVAKVYLAFRGSDARTTLNPDEFTMSFTEIFIGLFIALGCTFLPTICYTIAFADTQKQAKPATASANAVHHPQQRKITREVLRLVDPRSACQDKQARGLCA